MSKHVCSVCDWEGETYQALNAHKGQKHDTHIEKTCDICNDVFEVVESRNDTAQFCSYECRGKYQDENFHGKGNPAWNDSVSTEELVERYLEGETAYQMKDIELSTFQILERLRNAGVTIRDDTFGKSQETSFGLKVRSGNEAITAEWLHRFGPEFEYEPDFPGSYVPDFILENGTIIEVFGLKNDKYMERCIEKKEWYSEHGYNLKVVEPSDVEDMLKMMEVNQ